jgi:prohibitin 2
MNFIIPWFQRAIIYDVRTRPYMANTQTGSKDLQMIQLSLRVLYRPNPHQLPFIYRRLGKGDCPFIPPCIQLLLCNFSLYNFIHLSDFDERVLPSIVNEVAKAIVAKYNAAELLTKREVVSQEIREMLSERAREFRLILDDVSVTHLAFSSQYTAAVEAKQVAQQDAERSKYIVEKAIQEKCQIVIKAEGEAKSAELIGAAIRDNPAFLQLRRIEASKEVAHVIASSPGNKVYLNADSLLVNYLGNVPAEIAPKKSGWLN